MTRTAHRIGMALVASALGLVLALVPSQFGPEQAHAAISPEVPTPLNVLPSSYREAAAKGMYSFVQQAIYAAAGQVSNAQAAASIAVKAGTGTVNEAQLVAQMAAKFKGLPATALGAASKVVGPASFALASGQFGFWYGTRSATAMGFDTTNEGLCAVGESGWNLVAELVNGADCSGFVTPSPQFVENANSDINALGPGWQGTPSWASSFTNSSGVSTGTKSVLLEGSPLAFMDPRSPLPHGFDVTYTGTCLGNFIQASVPYYAYRIRTSTGAVTRWVNGAMTVSVTCDGGSIGSVSPVTLPGPGSGYTFDHIRFGTDDANGAHWYPEGHALWTPGVDPNPDRNLECVIHFTNGESRSALSEPFKETADELPPIVCPADYPPNWVPETFEIWEVGGGQRHLLQQENTTPEFQEVATAAPDCLDGSCVVLLHDRATGISCYENPVPCADWFTDPNKDTKFECRYGGNLVQLPSCTALAPTFKPGSNTSGAPYGDPVTGEPIPNPNGRAPLPSTVQDPDKKRDCFPTGWGVLNPVEWVMKPVGCALESAFVPRPSKVYEFQNRANTAWRTTTIAKSVIAVEGVAPVLANLSDGGCNGITVNLSGIAPNVLDLGTHHLLPACPGDFFAPWAPLFKAFLAIGITVGGFFSVKSQLSRFVGNGEA